LISSSGQKECCLFLWIKYLSKVIFKFASSRKTEAGSAGEQPARDNLMLEVNTSNSCSLLLGTAIYFWSLMPSKTH
jgi:hypothetical protein